MTIEPLRRLHQQQPFQPFDIHLADGRSLPVGHPEVLAITPPGRTIGVGLEDGTIEIVDLLLVTSVKPRPNGSRRSRKK
ncbi:MAG: hypothetical protein ACREJB_15155 [Planctomycetaceae bacterium]